MPRKVYRLENAKGDGPFYADQKCVKYLMPHKDPDVLIKELKLPDEVLKALCVAGFVFGWSTLHNYRKFFKKNGESACREIGFSMCVYKPILRFDFSDGQVMFSKPNVDLETEYLKLLLKALNKIKIK